MFMITPPIPGEKGYGYSMVAINDFAETILVRLVEWQANDYWKFWVDECRSLVEGERGKGVLPMAVYKIQGGKIVLGERLILWRVGDEVAVRSYALNRSVNDYPVSDWWKSVPDYRRSSQLFEVRTSLADMERWVSGCMDVMEIRERIASDGSLNWQKPLDEERSYNEDVFTDCDYLYSRDVFSNKAAWKKLSLDGMRMATLDKDLNKIGI